VLLEDYTGNAALTVACAWDNAACALLLLAHGANVNHVNGNGYTPLRQACLFGNSACVRVLLEHGADIFKMVLRLKSNNTGVQLALLHGARDGMVELLLEYGATVQEKQIPINILRRQQQFWSRQLQQQGNKHGN